ncbi:hypothetical protein AAMO2058_000733600 [Amorphochlora amoebiformis]
MWRPGSFWNLLGFLLLAFTDASRPLARLRAGVSKAYPIPSRSMGRMHGHRSIRLSPSPFQRSIAVACKEEGDPVPQESIPPSKSPSKRLSEIESTPDGIASGLTRRFGLAGGLAWLGFLTFGVVSEQVKTRTEVKAINEGAVLVDAPEVTTPSGLRFRDLKLGGGDKGCGIMGRTSGEMGCGEPLKGDLVTIAFDATLEDGTKVVSKRREISFVYGNRPNEAAAISPGLLEAIGSMTQGGIREVVVPPSLGFGGKTVETREGVTIPPESTIKYNIELRRVSVAPS